jgi:hypothetical protein
MKGLREIMTAQMSASKQIFEKSFAPLLTDASKLRYPGFVGTVAKTN